MRCFSARYTFAILGLAAVAHSAAQDGATALQQNYRTLLDNDEMQVVRVHYDPHQELAALRSTKSEQQKARLAQE